MISEIECLQVIDEIILHAPYEIWTKWSDLTDNAVGYRDFKEVCKKKGFDNLIRGVIKIISDYRE